MAQLEVWDPKPADISSHPVSFLMARLKNELGRADKTLPAVSILCMWIHEASNLNSGPCHITK